MTTRDRCFHFRMDEHGRKLDQPMETNLKDFCYFQKLRSTYFLPCESNNAGVDLKEHFINPVLNNCRIIDQNSKWSQLSFLEAY